MAQFRCLNDRCGKLSAVRGIDWYDGQHIVECEHCREPHALEQLPTPEGSPLQFTVAGLIND